MGTVRLKQPPALFSGNLCTECTEWTESTVGILFLISVIVWDDVFYFRIPRLFWLIRSENPPSSRKRSALYLIWHRKRYVAELIRSKVAFATKIALQGICCTYSGVPGSDSAHCNILYSASGGLNHLITSAGTFINIKSYKVNGNIINQSGELERSQFFITTGW